MGPALTSRPEFSLSRLWNVVRLPTRPSLMPNGAGVATEGSGQLIRRPSQRMMGRPDRSPATCTLHPNQRRGPEAVSNTGCQAGRTRGALSFPVLRVHLGKQQGDPPPIASPGGSRTAGPALDLLCGDILDDESGMGMSAQGSMTGGGVHSGLRSCDRLWTCAR